MAAGSLLLPNGDYLPAQTFSQDGHTVKGQEVVLCDASGTVIGVLAAPVRTDPTGTTIQPVSGTVTANAGSGTQAVSGPLTDAQLAARLPLSVEQATSVDIADGGGSITVDAPSGTPVRTDPTGTTAQPVTDNAGSLTVDNAGTFAVQDSEKVADNAGFTDGTTKVFPGGYIFDEAAGTALTENDAAAARIDSKRAQVAVIEDETTRGRRAAVTAANALKVDPSGVTQPVSGTVTASGPLTDTQLRASAVSVEQATSVTVDAGTGPFPVSDNAGSLTVDSPGLPVALDGVSLKVKEQSPLAQAQTDAQFAARLPLATVSGQPAATTGNLTAAAQDVTATGLGPYSVAVVTAQGTYTGANIGFYYDGTLGIGAPAINAQTGARLGTPTSVGLTNNADDNMWIVPLYGYGSLQVYANTVASGTVAISIQPTSAPGMAAAVSVTGSVTADTELPAAGALGDAMGNPSTPVIGANNLLWHSGSWARQQSAAAQTDGQTSAFAAVGLMAFNGTNWDRLRSDTTNGLDVDVTRLPRVTTSTVTNVAASATNVTLLSSNASRLGCYIQNDGTSTLYVKLGTTATATTSYSAKLAPGAFWEMPGTPLYTGRIDGIWTATGGNGALLTELTA